MVTSSGWGEKKIDKKLEVGLFTLSVKIRTKVGLITPPSQKTTKLIIPFMEYLENLGNAPSPSQAM